jgi:hypothetical protein
MMHEEARPYASLSSGLLARKGAAKPAMRPQGFAGGFEDLGWNDMGAPDGPTAPVPVEHIPSSIAALTPLPKGEDNAVAAQQRAIAETFEEAVEAAVETVEPAPVAERAPAEVVRLPKRQAVAAGKKAAFTLRLDGERHLRLRLACAVTGQSAQQLVAGALDEFLATLPEIDALAAQLPAKRR